MRSCFEVLKEVQVRVPGVLQKFCRVAFAATRKAIHRLRALLRDGGHARYSALTVATTQTKMSNPNHSHVTDRSTVESPGRFQAIPAVWIPDTHGSWTS